MKPVYSVAIMTIILSSFYFVFVCFVLFLSLSMQVSHRLCQELNQQDLREFQTGGQLKKQLCKVN